MIHLDYRDARPIYVQITDNLRSLIRSGVLRPGDKLPSVRELAAELAINPNTIQRSYRELEVQGCVASVPGKGCFVCAGQEFFRQEQAPLWQQLEQTLQQLEQLGVTREEILQHITKGGNTYD